MRKFRNRNSVKVATAPTAEPVTLLEAKSWMRVDGNTDDALITSLIKAAREYAESYTRRAFITQTLELTLDRQPSRFNDDAYYQGGTYQVAISEINPMPDKIELPRNPVQSITSVKSYGRDNAESTYSASNYIVDVAGARLVLNESAVWPSDLRDYAAIKITYVAGYGTAANVPEAIKNAIKMHVALMYDSRMACDLPDTCKTILDSYRIMDGLGYNG